MTEFKYGPILPLSEDTTSYRRLTADHVSTGSFEGEQILKIAPDALSLLAETAFREVSHLLRPAHLKSLAKIFHDPESSGNDRYVAL
ncbi:MAG: fumarate hydratase, partial [Desulfobacteraceae bacterium]|nr:fumarate hydratase [Desulfobacteraceae bacterium]